MLKLQISFKKLALEKEGYLSYCCLDGRDSEYNLYAVELGEETDTELNERHKEEEYYFELNKRQEYSKYIELKNKFEK